MSRSRDDIPPHSAPRRRRLRSRALDSVVGDLMQQSGSSSTNVDASYDRGNVYPALMHKPPYMDVQTVKTNLTVDQAAKLEGQSHCLLLMEPVLLPNLGHTDVGRETLAGDRPLFYPNGYKNCYLGTNVRNALFQSSTQHRAGAALATEPRQQFYGTASNPQQSYHDQSQGRSGCRQDEPEGPPSDWAGSSAYYSLGSESNSSGLNRNAFISNENSDEGSISAAVPAGQGGRFPTDVWGDPPGGDERGFNRKNGRCRRKKKRDAGAGGAWGAVAMRRSSSGSIDSGSIVDRRLARYVGKDGGGQGDCCPPRGSLLPGRTAEIARFRQQQLQYYLQKQQPQQQDPQHQRLPIGGNGRISVTEHVPAAGAEVFSRRDDLPLETFNTTPHSGTHERYSDSINAPPALSNRERGGTPESPATPCGWAAGDPANVEEGPICDAAGRDSEWLAERRAADREAKEVLGALKHYNTRLCFLVGGY